MLFGGHMSSAGGIFTAIDRIEAVGGDCVQVFTQSPRMWKATAHKPEAIERFRERREEVGLSGVVCHALYLVNLASEEFREKSVAALRATLATAEQIEADAVIFHVGSHLGVGFDSSVEPVSAALRDVLDGYDGTPWLAMENSAGRHDRPLYRRARDADGRPRPAPEARDLPRLLPSLRLRLRRARPRRGRC